MELNTIHFKDLNKRFETHIVSTKSLSNGNHYASYVKEFLFFLEKNEVFSLRKVDESLMKIYFNYLVNRPKFRGKGQISIRTVNDHLSTLRMFSLRMQEERVIDRGIPIPKNIRIEREQENDFSLIRQVLTIDELREVYNQCQNETERALIALAYGSGMRRSELAKLKETQIDFQKGIVTVLLSKNNKNRQVPISDYFLKVLREYSIYRLRLLSVSNVRETAYFIDEKCSLLSGDQLNKMLKKIICRTGNKVIIEKRITLHCLRHSIAVQLADSGVSFEYIRNFLGHSFSDTSMIYAKRRKLQNQYAV